MNRTLAWNIALTLVAAAACAGCGNQTGTVKFTPFQDLSHYNTIATHIDVPNVKPSPDDPVMASLSPDAVGQNGQVQYWDLKLEEAMHTSLARSKVLRDIGGTVLRTPNSAETIHGPAVAETDPQFGIEGALSEFDAVFSTSADSQHNDRAVNNVFLGGGTRILQQDLDTFQTQITKEAATGTQFTVRNNTVYDHNNEPGNLFPSAWDTNYEFSVRQHLLQGAGTEFNRIAGPHGAPGQMNGVLLARINTDISLTQFEIGVRDLASNVENAYWDLYFSYRDLDAKIAARDNALESWRRTHALFLAGRRGGEAEKEAEAREQYFQFQEEVQNAWSGRLVEPTETYNGSSGGTFRNNTGVRVAERRLRLLLGLPICDGRLIRPADEPSLAKVVFCWEDILPEAINRRPELRQQRWQIKRRELELIASRNFLLPTLDSFGLYRFRGFGHDLINSDPNQGEFDSAYGNLMTGNFQEWELGMELSMPIGERKAHAAVRNSQLLLSRDRAVLDEQERQVVNDLTNAMADLDRAYQVAQIAYNRRMSARAEVAATKAAYEADKVPLDLYLEAQRRQADAESRFFSALVEYALSVKNVHYEKGSLLDYNEVFLAEGPWPDKAYHDAATRKDARWQFKNMNYGMTTDPLGAGVVPQGQSDRPMAMPPQENQPQGAMQQGAMQQGPMPQGAAPEVLMEKSDTRQTPDARLPNPAPAVPQPMPPASRQSVPPFAPSAPSAPQPMPPPPPSPQSAIPNATEPQNTLRFAPWQPPAQSVQPSQQVFAPSQEPIRLPPVSVPPTTAPGGPDLPYPAAQRRDLRPQYDRPQGPVIQPAQRPDPPDIYRAENVDKPAANQVLQNNPPASPAVGSSFPTAGLPAGASPASVMAAPPSADSRPIVANALSTGNSATKPAAVSAYPDMTFTPSAAVAAPPTARPATSLSTPVPAQSPASFDPTYPTPNSAQSPSSAATIRPNSPPGRAAWPEATVQPSSRGSAGNGVSPASAADSQDSTARSYVQPAFYPAAPSGNGSVANGPVNNIQPASWPTFHPVSPSAAQPANSTPGNATPANAAPPGQMQRLPPTGTSQPLPPVAAWQPQPINGALQPLPPVGPLGAAPGDLTPLPPINAPMQRLPPVGP